MPSVSWPPQEHWDTLGDTIVAENATLIAFLRQMKVDRKIEAGKIGSGSPDHEETKPG